MEKKETSSQNPPRSVCEKLFNAFSVHNTAFLPIRRLTFKQQEPPAATAAPNLSPPKKPKVNVENHDQIKKPPPLDVSSYNSPKIEPHQSSTTTTTPAAPPKKPSHDVAQVQTPSKVVQIQNMAAQREEKKEIVPKVPVIPSESRKPNRISTRKEETAAPVALPPVSSLPTPTAPKVVVAPQAAQLPKPAPPPEVRRQPQRTETKNIDGKADDYISRIRNKLRSNSAVDQKTTSTT